MKILVIVDKFLPISETFILNQINSFDQHEVYIICRKRIYANGFVLNPKFKVISHYSSFFCRIFHKQKRGSYKFPKLTKKRLIEIFKDIQPDLVISHYGTNAIRVHHALKEFKFNHLVFFHGFDLSRKLSETEYVVRLVSLSKKSYAVVPSHFLGQKLIDNKWEEDRVNVIPYGVDLNKVISKSYNLERYVKILHVGRLVPKKGVIELFEVIKRLSEKYEVEFTIIGNGILTKKVMELIKSNPQMNVNLLHDKPHHEVMKYMSQTDIYVLNSRIDPQGETEGLPNTILEAMATGVCVVSTHHAGIPEAITHEESGLLVDGFNNEDLYESLRKVVENKELRETLGNAAQKRAKANYNLKYTQKRIVDLAQLVTSR